jgi:amino acid transporter
MTAERNARLASVAFLTAFALLAGYIFVVFFLPKLIDAEKDLHRASAWVGPADHLYHAVGQLWILFVIFSLFVITLLWRILSAGKLRKSKELRGFAVEQASPRQ